MPWVLQFPPQRTLQGSEVWRLCEALNEKQNTQVTFISPDLSLSLLWVSCPLRASQARGEMFWLWPSSVFWLIDQCSLFLLLGFWWDLCPPGLPYFSPYFHPSLLKESHYSGFITFDCFQTFTHMKPVRSSQLSDVRAAGWKLRLRREHNNSFSYSCLSVVGTGRDMVSVTYFLNTNLVLKRVHIVSVSKGHSTSEGWGQFPWTDFGKLDSFHPCSCCCCCCYD